MEYKTQTSHIRVEYVIGTDVHSIAAIYIIFSVICQYFLNPKSKILGKALAKRQ